MNLFDGEKMIKCVIKKLIVFIMIISMSIPSFSKLYQSDGSSFVTKAEFDSSMAGFNNRLTSFETGITSKIDSQVTSYLDRNGIWNQKKQTILNASINAPMPIAMGNNAWNSIGKVTTTPPAPLFKSNKSGLACIRCYYKTNKGAGVISNAWWGYRLVCRGDQKNLFDDALSISIVYVNSSNEKKFSWSIYNGSAWPAAVRNDSYTTDFLLAFSWPETPIYTNIYFFVNKDEDISWYFNAVARSGFNNAGELDNEGAGVFVIDSIGVY